MADTNMTTREKIQRAKQFVQDHQTVVACAVTGVVAYRLGHKGGVKYMLNATHGVIDGMLEDTTKIVHELGVKTGNEIELLQYERDTVLDFLADNDLHEDFREYIRSLPKPR